MKILTPLYLIQQTLNVQTICLYYFEFCFLLFPDRINFSDGKKIQNDRIFTIRVNALMKEYCHLCVSVYGPGLHLATMSGWYMWHSDSRSQVQVPKALHGVHQMLWLPTGSGMWLVCIRRREWQGRVYAGNQEWTQKTREMYETKQSTGRENTW